MLGQPCDNDSELDDSELDDSDLNDPELDNIDDHSTTSRSLLLDASEHF